MPVITLLSDLGLHDASAGAVKGILLSHAPSAPIIDISHEVPPFSIRQGAYLLGVSYGDFPARSVHIVAIDVYYAQQPRLILCYFNSHYFLVPDNGILQLATGDNPDGAWLCFELGRQHTFKDWVAAAAQTAHNLVTGGEPALPPYTLAPTVPKAFDSTACEVLYIDNFGNVVTDITRDAFDKQNTRGRFRLGFMKVNELSTLSHSYNEVNAGESLCRFNRHGHLEICVNQGSAASLFGLRMGSRHNEIKITFE